MFLFIASHEDNKGDNGPITGTLFELPSTREATLLKKMRMENPTANDNASISEMVTTDVLANTSGALADPKQLLKYIKQFDKKAKIVPTTLIEY
jgi:hypothetical protein